MCYTKAVELVKATLLDAAKGEGLAKVGRGEVVDGAGACLEPGRDGLGPGLAAGEDGAAQAKRVRVDQVHGVVIRGKPLDAHHRPEDLLVPDSHLARHAREDRGRVELAL